MSLPGRRLVAVAAVPLLLQLTGCGDVRLEFGETPPELVVRAEDVSGSLSATPPPQLRATLTQEGQPVVDVEVRFVGLDEDGDELGSLAFADTDAAGVAAVPVYLSISTNQQDVVTRSVAYRAEATLPSGASDRDTAGYAIRP